MFLFLYNLGIYLYALGIRIFALINPKASLWVKGRKGIFINIGSALAEENGNIAWFHCASLGEFEQGRPLMEAFCKTHPGYRILLTFFSPSGYEIRKNYAGADYIFYLPADTRKNARKFVSLVNPKVAFFIKYEFWFNYLRELENANIPVYIVSGAFRKDQHFFRWYGRWALEQLKKINRFFVQDEASKGLLNKYGITQVDVTGDTRFDRVFATSQEERSFPAVEKFCDSSKILLAGSSWPADEKVLIPAFADLDNSWKFIIAPHEVDPDRIASLIRSLPVPALRYSELTGENAAGSRVLVIDTIGILAGLYRYATIAYVGGAFGTGLHNILEAAVFGIPVIIGPDHKKFREAGELINLGGVFSIGSRIEFSELIRKLDSDPEYRKQAGEICRKFVLDRKGATKHILGKINV